MAKKRSASKQRTTTKDPTQKKLGTRKKAAKKKPLVAKKAAPKKKVSKKARSATATDKKASSATATDKKASSATATDKKASSVEDLAKTAADKPRLRAVGKPQHKAQPPTAKKSERKFDLRGAAPWVGRHAAKRVEALRKRNAEPPRAGSARATLRVPEDAEQIKNKVALLHRRTTEMKELERSVESKFYDLGELLVEVQTLELHRAKGFSSFESFLDRELELPRSVLLKLIRITHTFQRDTAYDFGLDRLTIALAALDGEVMTAAASNRSSHRSSRGWSSQMPPKPPLRFDE